MNVALLLPHALTLFQCIEMIANKINTTEKLYLDFFLWWMYDRNILCIDMADRGENLTGYGPRRANATGGRWQRLIFDRDKNNYKLWDVKFLGHLRIKETILSTGNIDKEKNEECYAELIQFLDEACHW